MQRKRVKKLAVGRCNFGHCIQNEHFTSCLQNWPILKAVLGNLIRKNVYNNVGVLLFRHVYLHACVSNSHCNGKDNKTELLI